jgi:hypothetical protein
LRQHLTRLYLRLGSEHTPPHPSTQFHFKDYCPMVFRNLRDKAGISVGDYIQVQHASYDRSQPINLKTYI